MTTVTQLVADVRSAVAAVSDPEFPGVSIEELGILHAVRPGRDGLVVELVPTFLGCPALEVIAADVRAAAATVADAVDVVFVTEPAWSIDRISAAGRRKLAEGFTVAVPNEHGTSCPVCSHRATEERSPFGPTACRAIAYCPACKNPLEVMKR